MPLDRALLDVHFIRARVLYLYVQPSETVYLMVAYEKSVGDSIGAAEKKQLKALAERLKED